MKLLRVVEGPGGAPASAARSERTSTVRVISATWAALEDRVGGRTLSRRSVPPSSRPSSSAGPATPGAGRATFRFLHARSSSRLREEVGPRELGSAAASAKLVAHCWPGNVRELGERALPCGGLRGPEVIESDAHRKRRSVLACQDATALPLGGGGQGDSARIRRQRQRSSPSCGCSEEHVSLLGRQTSNAARDSELADERHAAASGRTPRNQPCVKVGRRSRGALRRAGVDEVVDDRSEQRTSAPPTAVRSIAIVLFESPVRWNCLGSSYKSADTR